MSPRQKGDLWVTGAPPVFIAHPAPNVEPSEQMADVNTCVHKFRL